MNKSAKTTITLGFLLTLVILTGSIYILMPETVKLDIQPTYSKFYVWENNAWTLGATEYVYLYDGTTKMIANSRVINYTTEGNITKITRTATWKQNISTIDTYTFDSSITDKELFPISHTLQCTNCVGKIVLFEYRDLLYTDITKDVVSPIMFGHKMKIEWQSGAYYAKVFQQATSDKLQIKYKPTSNNEIYSVRMYDPEVSAINVTTLPSPYFVQSRQICKSGDGNLHTVYNYNNSQFYYGKSTDNGLTWSTQVFERYNAGSSFSAIGCDPTVGGTNVAIGTVNSSSNVIHMLLSTNSGTSWTFKDFGRVGSIGLNPNYFNVAVRGNRVYTAGVTTDSNTSLRYLSSWINGTLITNHTVLINATNVDFNRIGLAVYGTGNTSDKIIVIATSGDTDDATVRTSVDGGTTWDATIAGTAISSTGVNNCVLAWNNDGTMIHGACAPTTTSRIYYTNSSDGITWAAYTQIHQMANLTNHYRPTISMNNDNLPCVFWETNNSISGGAYNIMYTCNNGTAWTSPANFTTPATASVQTRQPKSTETYTNDYKIHLMYEVGNETPYTMTYGYLAVGTEPDPVLPSDITGLVAYWNFNSTLNLSDYYGRNNLSIAGSSPAPVYLTTPQDYGYNFSLDRAYSMCAPDSSSLTMTGNMTLLARFYVNEVAGTGDRTQIVSKYYDATTSSRSFQLSEDGPSSTCNGNFSFMVSSTVTYYTGALLCSNVSISSYVGQWVDVVGVYTKGVSQEIYVNGVPAGYTSTGVASSVADSAGLTCVMTSGDNSSARSTSAIVDEVAIYNRTLSATEILEYHNKAVLNHSLLYSNTSDTTAPTVTMVTSSYATTDTTPSVTFSFTDPTSSTATCYLYMNSTSRNSVSASVSTNTDISPSSALAVGSYTTFVRCTDASLNSGDSSSIQINITSAAEDPNLIYVNASNTACNSSGTGTQAVPYCTFSSGLTALSSGKTLYVVGPSAYIGTSGFTYSNKALTSKTSIIGVNNPVISGWIVPYNNTANGQWVNISNATYNMWYSSYVSGNTYIQLMRASDNASYFAHNSWSDFTNVNMAIGSYWDNTNDRIYIRFNDTTSNPNNIPIYVIKADILAITNVTGAELEISGLTIIGRIRGIYLSPSSGNNNITIRDNTLIGAGKGIDIRSGNDIRLINNTLRFSKVSPPWTWDDMKTSLEETSAIYLEALAEGRLPNINISKNTISGYFNGILTNNNYSNTFENIYVGYNVLSDIYDDALEIEHFCNNGIWEYNNVSDAYVALSVSPANATDNPTCIVRYNILNATKRQLATYPSTYYTGEAVKVIPSTGEYVSNFNFTHNTLVGRGIYASSIARSQRNTNWIDNLFYSPLSSDNRVIGRSGLASDGTFYDYNLYWKVADDNLFQYWNSDASSTEYNLSQAKASAAWDGTWDVNSIEANPLFTTNYIPASTSPACEMSTTGGYVGAVPCEVGNMTLTTVNYYFSMTDGLDTNSCALAYPCKTISKLNGITLVAGDTVYFKRGDIWREPYLFDDNSGTSGSRITFKDYGTGDKPRFFGSYNMSSTSNWTSLGGNLWETPGVFTSGADMIWYNSTQTVARYGNKELTYANVNTNWEFYYNSTSYKIIVYLSLGNPATYGNGIEIPAFNSTHTASWVNEQKDYINFYNLEWDYCREYCFYSQLTSNINFINTSFKYSYQEGLYLNGVGTDSNIYVTNNSLVSIGVEGVDNGGTNGGGENIWINSVNNVVINGTEIYLAHGVPINYHLTNSGTAVNNYIHDCDQDVTDWPHGVYYDGCNNTLTMNNTVANCMGGYSVNAEDNGASSNNNTFRYNKGYGNYIDFTVSTVDGNARVNAISNTTIDQNTFWRTTYTGLSGTAGQLLFKNFTGLTFTNNIVYNNYSNSSVGLFIQLLNSSTTGLGWSSDYNDWHSVNGANSFTIGSTTYTSLASYQSASRDSHSTSYNPALVATTFVPTYSPDVCAGSSTSSYIGAVACTGATNIYYVNKASASCSDSYTRAQAASLSTPWCTLDAPLTDDKLLSGDTLYIRTGEYNDYVDITGWTITANTTISAYPGDQVNITTFWGTRLSGPANGSNSLWTNSGGNVWYTDTVSAHDGNVPRVFYENDTHMFSVNAIGYVTGCTYSTGCSYYDTSIHRLHIYMPGGANPNNVKLFINAYYGSSQDTLFIKNNAISNNTYLIIQNLNFAYSKVATRVQNTSNVIIQNNNFRGPFHAVQILGYGDTSHINRSIIIRYNNVTAGISHEWIIEDIKISHYEEADAIRVEGDSSTQAYYGSVQIYNNIMHDISGGVNLFSTKPTANAYSNVYNNVFYDTWGSVLEIEDLCYASNWYNNTITDCNYAGASFAPADASRGPVPCTFHDNYIFCNGTHKETACGGTDCPAWGIKAESRTDSDSGSLYYNVSNWEFTHNTVYGLLRSVNGITGGVTPGIFVNTTWKDNIFISGVSSGGSYTIVGTGLASLGNIWDYNYWYQYPGGDALLARYNNDTSGNHYHTIALARASADGVATWDAHSSDGTDPLINYTTGKPANTSVVCDMSETESYIGAIPCITAEADIPSDVVVFTSVSGVSLNTTAIQISWTTNIPTNTSLKYGNTTAMTSTRTNSSFLTDHVETISGLSSGTVYYYNITGYNTSTVYNSSGRYNVTTTAVIVNVSITGVTSLALNTTAIRITWSTNIPTNETISYGTTASLGSTSTNSAFSTAHTMTISGLVMDTFYYFNVTGYNSSTLFNTSGLYNVTTPIVPGVMYFDGIVGDRTYEYGTTATILTSFNQSACIDIYMLGYGLNYLCAENTTQYLSINFENYTTIDYFSDMTRNFPLQFRKSTSDIFTIKVPRFLTVLETAIIGVSGIPSTDITSFDDWNKTQTSKTYAMDNTTTYMLNLSLRSDKTLKSASFSIQSNELSYLYIDACNNDTVTYDVTKTSTFYTKTGITIPVDSLNSCVNSSQDITVIPIAFNFTSGSGNLTISDVRFRTTTSTYPSHITIDANNDSAIDFELLGELRGSTGSISEFNSGSSYADVIMNTTGLKSEIVNVTVTKGLSYNSFVFYISSVDATDVYEEDFSTNDYINMTSTTAEIDNFWNTAYNSNSGGTPVESWVYSSSLPTYKTVYYVYNELSQQTVTGTNIYYYVSANCGEDWTYMNNNGLTNIDVPGDCFMWKARITTEGSTFGYIYGITFTGLGYVPSNIAIDVANDGIVDYTNSAFLGNSNRVSINTSVLDAYLETCTTPVCTVPINVSFYNNGILRLSSLSITYDTDALSIDSGVIETGINDAKVNRTTVSTFNDSTTSKVFNESSTYYISVPQNVIIKTANATIKGGYT